MMTDFDFFMNNTERTNNVSHPKTKAFETINLSDVYNLQSESTPEMSNTTPKPTSTPVLVDDINGDAAEAKKLSLLSAKVNTALSQLQEAQQIWHSAKAKVVTKKQEDSKYVIVTTDEDPQFKLIVTLRLFLHYVYGPEWTAGSKLDSFEKVYLLNLTDDSKEIPLLISFESKLLEAKQLNLAIKIDPLYFYDELIKLECNALKKQHDEKQNFFTKLWHTTLEHTKIIKDYGALKSTVDGLVLAKMQGAYKPVKEESYSISSMVTKAYHALKDTVSGFFY